MASLTQGDKNMTKEENEELFNNLEDESPEDASDLIEEDEEVAVEQAKFEATFSDKSKQELEEERGVKKDCDGQTLTIQSITIKAPITKKIKDGILVPVSPTKTLSGKDKYDSKLIIRFAEENIVEYVPGINFFLRPDGSINSKVTLNRSGDNGVSRLVKLALSKMLEEKGTKVTDENIQALSKVTSDKAIIDFLTGKKVQIKTARGKYQGKPWYRNDVEKIL